MLQIKSISKQYKTGDLIQRSTSDVEQTSTFVASMVPGLIDIFVTVSIGAYRVYQISPILMWVSLISIPFTALSSVLYFKYCYIIKYL